MISFGWTTPALLAGVKTRTRRDWSERTREQMAKAFERGDLIDAWNTSPRNKAGNPRKIATLRLTSAPVQTTEYPAEDWEREGLAWLQMNGYLVDSQPPRELWRFWLDCRPLLTLVEFEVVEYLD